MKVTAAAALLLLSWFVSCDAGPMFGTGGMMKRRFPGAPDMSYLTYRQIADARKRGEDAAVVPRTGGQKPLESDEWMFGNQVGLRTGFNRPVQSFEQDSIVHSHPGGDRPHFHTDNSDEDYFYRYPSYFNPRDSFAPINFPSYHRHTSAQRPSVRRGPGYQQNYMPKYY